MATVNHFDSLDEQAVRAIAALFGVKPTVEPYTVAGAPVYRIAAGGAADGITLMLWPALSRVDVNRAGEHSWVLKDVGRIEVVQGVEVIFRPRDVEGHLFVSVNGFVNMVIG